MYSPISQTPPQPFQRTKVEIAQPNRADDELQNPNSKGEVEDLIKLQFSEVIQAITKEKQGANDRVHDVIGESHLSNGFEATEKTLYFARFIE